MKYNKGLITLSIVALMATGCQTQKADTTNKQPEVQQIIDENNQIREDVTNLTTKVQDLEKTIEEKDTEIKKLQQEVTDKDAQIDALTEQVDNSNVGQGDVSDSNTSNQASKKRYRVVSGSFEKKSNAQNQINLLKGKGFDSFMSFENNHYRIVAGSYASLNNAKEKTNTLEKAGFDSFVIMKLQ